MAESGDPPVLNYTPVLRYFFSGIDKFAPDSSTKQASIDREINDKFGSTLAKFEKCSYLNLETTTINRQDLDYYNRFCSWLQTPHGLLAVIIVLDQFSRHIYRDRDPNTEKGKANCRSTFKNDKYALLFSQQMFENGWTSLLTDEQFQFALMPRRHKANPSMCPDLDTTTLEDRIEHVTYVMQEIDDRVGKQGTSIVLQNFWRVSNDRLSSLFQERNEEHKEETNREERNKTYMDITKSFNYGGYSTEDILAKECWPYTSGMSIDKVNVDSLKKEPLYKSVVESYDTSNSEGKSIIVSLSGGVDSMNVAFCANNISPNIIVVAVHINYGNRKESSAESAYVERWCAQQNPPIIFRKTVIDPTLRRGETPRDEYEDKTKNIRFTAYTKAINEFGSQGCIFVGHNVDDIGENVLNNIFKKNSLLDISGMYPSNVINGVQLVRPLLNTFKGIIFAFAHKYNIPYHKDTTPRGCTRGMIRHQLMPLLNNVYKKDSLCVLKYMSEQSMELYDLTDSLIWQPVLSKVQGYKGTIKRIRKTIGDGGTFDNNCLGLWLNYKAYIDYSKYFWKEILAMMCHSMGICQIGNKALDNIFMPKLKTVKKEPMWLKLREDLLICLHNEHVYLLPISLFDEQKAEYEDVSLNVGKIRKYKKWNISLDLVDLNETYDNKITFNDIMSGKFKYYLPYMETRKDNSVVESKYHISNDKKITPTAFKNGGLDPNMKSLVPLVCLNSRTGSKDELKVSDKSAVKVSYQFFYE
jgi:tRNA(Ile)-lysidine synthetase-like protein